MEALIIGDDPLLTMAASGLLSRSGFGVDVISRNKHLRHLNCIKNFFLLKYSDDLVSYSVNKSKNNYSLIIITDDFNLKTFLDSAICIDEKLKFLPVISPSNLKHMCSKIGLSHVFQEKGIQTPDFLIAHNHQEIKNSVHTIGFPLLVKIDFSGAGFGVFECSNTNDLLSLHNKITSYPVLVQKKIEGSVLDVGGFFQEGKLIYFSRSEFLETYTHKFGPSITRSYRPLKNLQKTIFDELAKIGEALGANGFVNISCVESSIDKTRYYFEADMRPTVWLEYPKYFENDPAERIRNYFKYGKTMPPPATHENTEQDLLLPYLPRMKWYEIATNRHKCWQYFDNYLGAHIFKLLLIARLYTFAFAIAWPIKPYLPSSVWTRLRKIRRAVY